MVSIEKLKVLSLFSGIGAFEKALSNIGIDYELVGYSEVDDGYGKELQRVYEEMHNAKDKYLGLVQGVKGHDLGQVDIITHGSPCQSFSIAGLQEGADEGSDTKSSLMWETVRIIKESKPKFVIWENVKSVLHKKHIPNFNKYIETMDNLGYESYYDVLRASDFGLPQKRERVFVVSVPKGHKFEIPKSTDQSKRLSDILEDEVDDKYDIPRDMITNWYNKKPPFGDRFSLLKRDDVGYTLVAKGGRAVITNNYILKNESDCALIDKYKKKDALGQIISTGVEIRALTPREYWRMMGWSEASIDQVRDMGVSDARLYKMAGNSIPINVLEEIFKSLFKM